MIYLSSIMLCTYPMNGLILFSILYIDAKIICVCRTITSNLVTYCHRNVHRPVQTYYLLKQLGTCLNQDQDDSACPCQVLSRTCLSENWGFVWIFTNRWAILRGKVILKLLKHQ